MRKIRTFSFALYLLGVPVFAPCFLLVFLTLSALVEVLDDHADEHVQNEEADEQQERDEVRQTPLVMIRLRLQQQQQLKSKKCWHLAHLKAGQRAVWFKLTITVTEMTINENKSNPLTVTEKFH